MENKKDFGVIREYRLIFKRWVFSLRQKMVRLVPTNVLSSFQHRGAIRERSQDQEVQPHRGRDGSQMA